MENEQTRRTTTRRACTSEGNAMARTKDMFTLPEGVDQELCEEMFLEKVGPFLCNFQEEVVHQLDQEG